MRKRGQDVAEMRRLGPVIVELRGVAEDACLVTLGRAPTMDFERRVMRGVSVQDFLSDIRAR